jgi:serine/threonine protein kinase
MIGQLVVISGPDTGRVFNLEEGQTLVLGRGLESHTQLGDPAASRKHCVLQVAGGRFTLVDNGSTSGTFVNGDRVSQHDMQPGDVLRIGASELRLQLAGTADQTTISIPSEAPAKGKPTAPRTSLTGLVGHTLAHFEIKRPIAKGSSGAVFLAHDTQENRPAAVKVLWPDITQKEDELQRFVRAMKTMMPITHENIVEIYAAGKTGNHCWVAMEYVDGESLTDIIEKIGTSGMLDWRTAFRACVHVARALEKAFEHQIIHRNVTPQNILRRSADKVSKLGDLMLAKALEGTLARQVTQPGQLIGDLGYMSPERTRVDADVDCRSDIYSLGATAYALLTGRPPFGGDSVPAVVSQIRSAEPKRPKQFQMAVPDRFEDVIMVMLAKRPEDRYPNPSKLLLDLDRIAKFENVPV